MACIGKGIVWRRKRGHDEPTIKLAAAKDHVRNAVVVDQQLGTAVGKRERSSTIEPKSGLSDGFSSFRAVRRSKLATVTPPGRGPVQFFALSIEAMKRGSRIQEIPTVEVTRSTWQVINDSLSTVFPALLILAREWWSRRRPGSGEVK